MATSLSTRNGNIGMTLPTSAAARINNILPSKHCSNCGCHTPSFLHQVRHSCILRRLCTACVLRLHRDSFCPGCFEFYAGSPPDPSKRVPCSNCPSITHSKCAGGNLLTSYLCPPCKDSSFSFFSVKDNKIDKKLALALLCAAKIASYSMGNAVYFFRAEAERKTREAMRAHKRVKEALHHLCDLIDKENVREANENLDLVKVEKLELETGEEDGDEDGDIDVDLVRHIEDTLVNVEDFDTKLN